MTTIFFGTVAIVIAVLFILYVLLEALFYDEQKTRFKETMMTGMPVLLDEEEFQVVSVDYENETAVVANLYHEPFKVDISRLYPIKPYRTVFKIMYDHLKERYDRKD